jgi:hypothetical protein
MTDVPSPGSLPPPGEPEGRSPVTWIIGGAAALVALTAAFIWLRASNDEPSQEPTAAALSVSTAALGSAEPKPPVDPLGPNPLDTSKTLVDATQRAHAWNGDALLAGMNWDIEGGKPKGPLQISYGIPTDGLAPGARLGSQRLSLEYTGLNAAQKTTSSKEAGVGLPDPNCPPEVAWQKATETGIDRAAAVSMRYESNKKLRRPVWSVQTSDGKVTRLVDGSSCAVLMR